jgi:nicotinate phosphoribosyltransferase
MEKAHCDIDTYAIGTNIATCQKQPALGLVYKLVEFQHRLTMKFSDEKEKITFPGRKSVFRIWTEGEEASFDLITYTCLLYRLRNQ